MGSLVGQKLGKYEITRRIARGGMSDVFKAKQTGLDRDVAIKVMHLYLAQSEEFVTRFKREAESISRLRHPHIVQLYDFDIEGDTYYMVMEFAKGGTLDQLIREKGKLSPAKALDIVIPLVDALGYAHRAGIIHRDIKPGNILFTDLQFSHPVLTDFGITLVQGGTALTGSGKFIGTPGYMSPEAGLSETMDKRTDIYSMGVLMYEMLTGRVPYTGQTPFAIFKNQVDEPLPDPRQLVPNLPGALVDVLCKALAPLAEDRYQSAEELKDALEQVQSQLPPGDYLTTRPEHSLRSVPTPVFADEALQAVPLLTPIGIRPRAKRASGLARFVTLMTVLIAATGALMMSDHGAPPAQISEQTDLPTSTSHSYFVDIAQQTAWTAPTESAPTPTDLPDAKESPTMSGGTVTPTVVLQDEPTAAVTEDQSQTEPIAPTLEPHLLALGTSLVRHLVAGEPAHHYRFAASGQDAMFLLLTSQDETLGLAIRLEHQGSGELVALLRPGVTGACIRINPGANTYLLAVGSEDSTIEGNYILSLTAAEPQALDCPSTLPTAEHSR